MSRPPRFSRFGNATGTVAHKPLAKIEPLWYY